MANVVAPPHPSGSHALDAAGRPASRPAAVAEAVALLLSPLLAVWPLRAQLWATTRWIDPYLHTAVIQHGRDLLERFGADNRQFARAGFVVPGRLLDIAFGDIDGYLAFRYLLALIAVVPAYLLFRRLHGRGAGAVAVAAVLANPVVLRAWGTDYGDSSAVAYLVAGLCCLGMPASSPRRRARWVALAGVALTLALHSNFVTAPLVALAVGVHAAFALRAGARRALVDLAVLAGALVVTTAALVGAAKLLFGVADIFTPTWRGYLRLRMADQVRLWHTPGRRWALDSPYLLVPPAAVGAWAGVRMWRRNRVAPAEAAIVVTALLQLLALGYLQFADTEQALEFYLYSSTLWPSVVLVTAFAVTAVAAPLLRRPATAWLPAALLLAAPLVAHRYREDLVFRVPWTGALLAAGIVAVAVAAGGWERWRLPWRPAAALVATLGLVAGALLLTTGKDTRKPWLPGQIHFPPPTYAAVVDTPYGTERDRYAVASQLHHLVPPPSRPGMPLLMWWPARYSEALNLAAAQYLWNPEALRRDMPVLSGADVATLRKRRPDVLVLLSDTGTQFPAAVRALAAAGFPSVTGRPATLHSGRVTLHVQVLRLAPPVG